MDKAIEAEHLSKIYRLYGNNKDRLKEMFRFYRKEYLYKEYHALEDISFSIFRGETVGIIGTNGSGKSTVLKIIAGVLNATFGEVKVHGRISALLELGAGFNMEYSGIDNIYLNGMMLGLTKEEVDEKISKIIEFAEIGDFVFQPVKTYSSGMFARLAFALAINVEPDILVVDEALSVGDIYFQSRCFKKMDDIKRGGTTILLVTHDMSSVIKYCDKVVVMNHGRVVREGSPRQMVDIYKKILVNQYDENEEDGDRSAGKALAVEEGSWMSHLSLNDENVLYGNGKAEIVDFGFFDESGRITGMILKKSVFSFKVKVKFFEDIEYPIFTYTVKNAKGAEITGTNTMFEKVDFPLAKKGEQYVVTFTQKALLQGGEYLVSFGCTGYEDGQFTVYDRHYDVANLTIVSEQNTVGTFDMDSGVTVERVEDD